MHKKLILASGSPRRKELLRMLEIPFQICIPDVEEVVTGNDPAKVTEELSAQKAEAVADTLQLPDRLKAGYAKCDNANESADQGWLVIGADTVVSLDGKILGKPKDRSDAIRTLCSLQGRAHMVYTGVTLISKDRKGVHRHTFSVGTEVTVASMTIEEIEHYVDDSGECMDKAGSYGIQGVFARHIEKINGDYYNVVGLPVQRLYKEIKMMI